MAKSPNGLGQFSGKVGGVVFAISNGEQIVRSYQPVVSNPKTALQNQQRAKCNLTGRISSFVPKSALYGLGINNRRRRAEFLRNIMRSAVVIASTENEYKASIQDDEIVFSKGSALPLGTSIDVTAAANLVTATVHGDGTSVISAEEYATLSMRLVLMVYNANGDLAYCSTKMAVKPNQLAVANTLFTVPIMGEFTAKLYAIPMSTVDGSAMNVTTEMANLDDDEIIARLFTNKSASILEYGNSFLAGTGVYDPE